MVWTADHLCWTSRNSWWPTDQHFADLACKHAWHEYDLQSQTESTCSWRYAAHTTPLRTAPHVADAAGRFSARSNSCRTRKRWWADQGNDHLRYQVERRSDLKKGYCLVPFYAEILVTWKITSQADLKPFSHLKSITVNYQWSNVITSSGITTICFLWQ